jgi:lysophospholipase L1-like esterase
MNKKQQKILAIALLIVFVLSGIVAFLIYQSIDRPALIRVACVGDSLTQSTAYPYNLWALLGGNYTVENFGVGSTTVSLNTETPYMNTNAYQNALKSEPDIVIIMLGTNDAQPNLKDTNTTFAGDYITLIDSFKALDSKPQIWVVLPPPIFSNKSGQLDSAYYSNTLIPLIAQAANQTDVPTINVYSALLPYPNYFPDGEHPNHSGAKIIADTIYTAIKPDLLS